MRRLKVTLPAGLAVAALCGLAGCGGSSTGATDAGAPQDVFAIPDRLSPLVALYRMLPTP